LSEHRRTIRRVISGAVCVPCDGVTNLATWERPEAFAWDEVPSKEDPTRRYYWNAVSGTTTWEKPAVLAWKTAEYGFW